MKRGNMNEQNPIKRWKNGRNKRKPKNGLHIMATESTKSRENQGKNVAKYKKNGKKARKMV